MTATQSSTGAEERDRALAYLLVRLVVGTNLFGHGLVRLPKLSAFHGQLMREFQTSILPEIRGLVMIVLVFGSTSIEHFGVVGEQLIHASLLAALLMFRRHNTYSIDHIIARNRR